jgi:hypothetical protein
MLTQPVSKTAEVDWRKEIWLGHGGEREINKYGTQELRKADKNRKSCRAVRFN